MVVAFIRNFIFLQATVFYYLSNNVFSQHLGASFYNFLL
jgi:hypothetical protein